MSGFQTRECVSGRNGLATHKYTEPSHLFIRCYRPSKVGLKLDAYPDEQGIITIYMARPAYS